MEPPLIAVDAPTPRSLLGRLPVRTWASRLTGGTLSLQGRVLEPTPLSLGLGAIVIPPGDLVAETAFEGGQTPRIGRFLLRSSGVAAWGPGWAATGEVLELVEGVLRVDERATAAPDDVRPEGRLLALLVEALWDVVVEVRAEANAELTLGLGGGFSVQLGEGTPLSVQGAGSGAPDELRLSEALVVGFDGEALRLSHDRLGGVARAAAVRVAEARLEPDGTVALEGGASRGLDLAVKKGLAQASARMTDLVRTSPSFRRVREFLPEPE